MKSLTLHRPWAGLVAAGIKAVENRTWPPPPALIGQRLAIHAGKKWDEAGCQAAFEVLVGHGVDAARALVVTGGRNAKVEGIVAVVTVAGWATMTDAHRSPNLSLTDAIRRVRHSPWFIRGDAYGWLLTDVVALPEPVPCRGAQGLWSLPADVEAAVQRQIARRA